MNRFLVLAAVAIALAALPGCSEPDGRMADMAQQVTHEQSQQNQRIAEGSRAVAEGSKPLIEADAKARGQLIGLQRDLQQDQSAVARERDKLEGERQAIAGQRVQESKAGAFFVGLAVILVCLAPWSWPACGTPPPGRKRVRFWSKSWRPIWLKIPR